MNRLVTIAFALIFIPQIVLAAWWNPFSWNWKLFFNPQTSNEQLNENALGPVKVDDSEVLIEQKTKVEPVKTSSEVVNVKNQNSLSSNSLKGISELKVEAYQNTTKIEWQTDEATQSKVFVFKNGVLDQTVPSIHGLSTRHTVTIQGSFLKDIYSYEIESIYNNGKVVKLGGVIIAKPAVVFERDGTNPNYILVRNNSAGRLEIKGLYFRRTHNDKVYNLLSPTSAGVIDLDSTYIEPFKQTRIFVPKFEENYSSLEYIYGSIIDSDGIDVEFQNLVF